MNKSKALKILLVEDNEAEVYQLVKVIKSHNKYHEVEVLTDGSEVVNHLMNKRNKIGNHYPDLILLDLNLPKYSGRQLIVEIKNHEMLKSTPIIVLTSSDFEQDVKNSYRGKISSYVLKPAETDLFEQAIISTLDFYSITQMPSKNYSQ